MRERSAADPTPWRREKGQARPAAAAQTIRLVNGFAAAEAARRQDRIDDGSANPQQSAGRPAGKACRGLHRYTSSGQQRLRQRAIALRRGILPGFLYKRLDGAQMTSAEPVLLFDRRAWCLHRERAARRGCVEFLHAEVADRLVERLGDITRDFAAILHLGVHEGALARALETRPGLDWAVATDPAVGFLRRLSGTRVAADPELVPFRDRSFDLVISGLTLHWVGDLPGTLVQIRRVLKPGGLFLAAMLGGASLVELRTVLIEAELTEEGGASPRVSPAADLADVASLLLRTGFAMPVGDAEKVTVSYPDALALMRDLRGMGETNALSARRRTPLRRATLARCIMLYAERFGLADGRIPATFEILFLTGWAPEVKG
jgi:SAM-dependent methyltransferase